MHHITNRINETIKRPSRLSADAVYKNKYVKIPAYIFRVFKIELIMQK